MKKETKAVGIVLALVLSITSIVVAQALANPVRDLPESVKSGEDFNVTVTWTAPADNFNAIGLTDNANNVTPENNTIEYTWYGPYSNGTSFTAVYSAHVPIGAPAGNSYDMFSGNLFYYIGSAGPYTEGIAGDSMITIEKLKAIFDTGSPENPYPSIFGIHNGAIMPMVTLTTTGYLPLSCFFKIGMKVS